VYRRVQKKSRRGANLRKRAVKAPKIHFVDTGLACHLLRIRTPEQLQMHPLRGAIFESWVASEVLKARLNLGLSADLYHLRENRGSEIDLLIEEGRTVTGVEVKSGCVLTRSPRTIGPVHDHSSSHNLGISARLRSLARRAAVVDRTDPSKQ